MTMTDETWAEALAPHRPRALQLSAHLAELVPEQHEERIAIDFAEVFAEGMAAGIGAAPMAFVQAVQAVQVPRHGFLVLQVADLPQEQIAQFRSDLQAVGAELSRRLGFVPIMIVTPFPVALQAVEAAPSETPV